VSIEVENGQIVDARAACGGYFVEWGEANIWGYSLGFSGTTTGVADTTPEPACFVTLISGAIVAVGRRISLIFG